MDDDIGFTYFLDISYKQHKKDFPFDNINFHDFSSICLQNWESLDEEPKKKINELAKKEQENEIKERKPKLETGKLDNPISLDESDVEIEDEICNLINSTNVISIGETFKKNFGKEYTFCKKPRSAYIYFVKAARHDLKDRIKCSKDNFIEISKAISYKWKEMKVNQRKIFEDLALLDKRFNGFKTQQSTKKKISSTNHTPLFLKAKEARNEIIASTSTARVTSLINSLNSSRPTTSRRRTVGTKRKVKRKRTKRKTSKKTAKTTKKSTKVSIKKEIKKEFKVERKIKLKREF